MYHHRPLSSSLQMTVFFIEQLTLLLTQTSYNRTWTVWWVGQTPGWWGLMLLNAIYSKLPDSRNTILLASSYTIKGVQLQQVDHQPYLGVELTSDLTWKTHISNITSKANRILNLLRRHLYGCKKVKSRAFSWLVRLHLEYSSSVWDPYFKQDISAIEKVQRKGARFITGNYILTEIVLPPC